MSFCRDNTKDRFPSGTNLVCINQKTNPMCYLQVHMLLQLVLGMIHHPLRKPKRPSLSMCSSCILERFTKVSTSGHPSNIVQELMMNHWRDGSYQEAPTSDEEMIRQTN